MMNSEAHNRRFRTGELLPSTGIEELQHQQQEVIEQGAKRPHKPTRTSDSESPGEALIENLDIRDSKMCQSASQTLCSDGPCPKASESVSLMVLRDHLRLNLMGMEQLILFDLWSLEKATVEKALKKLSDLCSDNKDDDAGNNRSAFQLVNGFGIILEVMRKWSHDRKIQSLCCLVILNTLDGVDPTYLARLEIVDAVLLAMKTHPTFFPVQLCGCGALTGLCQNISNVDHLVRNRQGIETIITAMQRYPTSKKIQSCVCLCLENILKWKDYRKAFLDVWVRVTIEDALFRRDGVKKGQPLLKKAGQTS